MLLTVGNNGHVPDVGDLVHKGPDLVPDISYVHCDDLCEV